MKRNGGLMELADINLYDLDSWAQRVLHQELTHLRAEQPIFRQQVPGGRPFWAITKAEHSSLRWPSKQS